jgi:hypothetical protein
MASSQRGVLRRLLMSDGVGKGVRDTCVTTYYQVYVDPKCPMTGLLKCRFSAFFTGRCSTLLLELARLCLEPPPLVSFDPTKEQVLHKFLPTISIDFFLPDPQP